MKKSLHGISRSLHDIAHEMKEEYTNKEKEMEMANKMYAVVKERETKKKRGRSICEKPTRKDKRRTL